MAENTLSKSSRDELDERIDVGIAFIVLFLMGGLGAYLMMSGDAPVIDTVEDAGVVDELPVERRVYDDEIPTDNRRIREREVLETPAVTAAPVAAAAPIEEVVAPPPVVEPAPVAEPIIEEAIELLPATEPPATYQPEPPAEIFQPVEQPVAEPVPEVIEEFVPEAVVEPIAEPVQTEQLAEISEAELAILQDATSNVSFLVGNAILTEESKSKLDDIAAILSSRPNTRLRVTGFTDNQGDPDDNLELSFSRAEACREYLLANGASVGQIDTLGLGSRQPVADNSTREGRRLNRRVEFTLLSGSE